MTNPNLSKIVIVGRPNVGKSTLFNRIVGRRIAVIEDTPGVTRDRIYSQAEWNGIAFNVVDTGGILFSEDDPLIEQIRVQAQIALAEADIIFFVVDAVSGLCAGDIELANLLRPIKKPIYILSNKSDNPTRALNSSEFYSLGLGGDLYPVSGLHGTGVADVLDEVVKVIPAEKPSEEEISEIRLAIVGRPNVGKSSLLNAFTGEKRAIVSSIPGTTRDAIDTVMNYKGKQIRLIDTAGLRRRGKIQGTVEYYMALRSTRAIQRADCAVIIVDGTEGLTDGDKRTAKLAHDMGRAVVVAVNKWDEVEPPKGNPKTKSPEKKAFLQTIADEMPEIGYAPVCFISAKESSGLDVVLKNVFESLESWSFRISTGQFNKLIQDAVYDKPLTRKGRNLRIYYSTQISTAPPTFALFCNDTDLVHFSYLRYLENCIRKKLPLAGTQIRLYTRSSHKSNKED